MGNRLRNACSYRFIRSLVKKTIVVEDPDFLGHISMVEI